MKRTLACLLIVLMLLLLVPTVSYAVDAGEMEIVTDPETIEGEVGEVVKVNFYLYPNLPENLILNSVQGVLLYDADMLKFGAIVTKDEEHARHQHHKGRRDPLCMDRRLRMEGTGLLVPDRVPHRAGRRERVCVQQHALQRIG